MFTIRQAAEAFAAIDGIPADAIPPAYDKALRHISQRHYLIASGRSGNADTYAMPAICALRLMQKASAFGLDRWQLEALSRWLQNDPTGPARKQGQRSMPPVLEAIDRTLAGETFGVHVVMYSNGATAVLTDWPHDNPQARAKADAAFASLGDLAPREDARFTLPASRLIQEVAEKMGTN